MQALIIVDMQQASIANSNKYDTLGVVQRINVLAQSVRQHQGLVIFIAHDGEEAEGLFPHSAGWQILDALVQTKSDIIIRKTANDAFYNTRLATILKESNIEDLIICGWATDFCVDTTIKSALSQNYQVTVAADCHTLSDRPNINAADAISYFNWLWANMLSTKFIIRVQNAADIPLSR